MAASVPSHCSVLSETYLVLGPKSQGRKEHSPESAEQWSLWSSDKGGPAAPSPLPDPTSIVPPSCLMEKFIKLSISVIHGILNSSWTCMNFVFPLSEPLGSQHADSEKFKICEVPRSPHGKEMCLSTAVLWDCTISLPRFLKNLQEIKSLMGNIGMPPEQMIIQKKEKKHTRLGYRNRTYLQYLKSNSNMTRCKIECIGKDIAFQILMCFKIHLWDSSKMKITRCQPLKFWSGVPQIYCFNKHCWWACCRWFSKPILERHQYSKRTQFLPSPLAVLQFSHST